MKAWRTVLPILLSLLLFLPSAGLTGALEKQLTGEWVGAIEVPGMRLEIVVYFTVGEGGTLSGTIDIPAQGARGLPLTNIRLVQDSVSFALPAVPGNAFFRGLLGAGGGKIFGQFHQFGQTFPFTLQRKGEREKIREQSQWEGKLQEIRTFVDSLRHIWKVPGVALAIVREDRVVLTEGFGWRNAEEKLPVTPRTLFAIGSCTKAFTTLALAMLVDSGKVEWDKPVQEYMPDFRLSDPVATTHLTPRDLVTHRSGLPRHDFVWYNAACSRTELYHRLRYLPPNQDIRTVFQYQNLMYLAAGILVEKVSGESWEDFVRTRIFQPLGMNGSNFSVETSRQTSDFALPYKKKGGKVVRIPFRNIDAIGPAGSINSCATDLAQWMRLQLNNGRLGERQLVNPTVFKEMHTPQMHISEPVEYGERLNQAYGLGWFLEVYRGHLRVYHGGRIDGFSALVSLFPREHFGVAVLTNLAGTPLPSVIAFYVADLFLNLEPVDWNARFRIRFEQAEKMEKEKKIAAAERVEGTRPSHQLDAYVGRYRNPGYGDLIIEREGKQLKMLFSRIGSRLEHWHYDVFRARDDVWGEMGLMITFLTNEAGDIEKLSVPFEKMVDPIVFVRQPSSEMSSPTYLAKLVGEYELDGQRIRFELRGKNRLFAVVAGQPAYEMLPYREAEFQLKGLSGFRVKFKFDREGKVQEALFLQPNGVFSARRIED